MKIEIPDELVNRLVTAADTALEAQLGIERALSSSVIAAGLATRENYSDSMESRVADQDAAADLKSRARRDFIVAASEIRNLVYKTATGKAVPQEAL